WTYTGGPTKIAPSDPGYALDLVDVMGDTTVHDLEIVAAPGTAASVSSIAVRVARSTATFTRAKLVAQAGFKGADGAGGTTGTVTLVNPAGTLTLDGLPGSG